MDFRLRYIQKEYFTNPSSSHQLLGEGHLQPSTQGLSIVRRTHTYLLTPAAARDDGDDERRGRDQQTVDGCSLFAASATKPMRGCSPSHPLSPSSLLQLRSLLCESMLNKLFRSYD